MSFAALLTVVAVIFYWTAFDHVRSPVERITVSLLASFFFVSLGALILGAVH